MSNIKNLQLTFNAPITENFLSNDNFTIKGVAINATITANNHLFLEEELQPAAKTLKGVPLLVDHRNEIDAIKGRVSEGTYDVGNKRVLFEANVIDREVRSMIQDGRINSVSIGAVVKDVEEMDNGTIVPRGITIKELSLVAVPADSGATFTYALQEAYESQRNKIIEQEDDEEMVKCKECGKMIPESKMKKHMETMHESQSQDNIYTSERGINMEEQKETENSELIALKEKLAEAQKLNAEFKARETKALVEKYVSLCAVKGVSALDTSKLDESVIQMLIAQVDSIKEKKAETKVAEKEITSSRKGTVQVLAMTGPKGTSYTVERY